MNARDAGLPLLDFAEHVLPAVLIHGVERVSGNRRQSVSDAIRQCVREIVTGRVRRIFDAQIVDAVGEALKNPAKALFERVRLKQHPATIFTPDRLADLLY